MLDGLCFGLWALTLCMLCVLCLSLIFSTHGCFKTSIVQEPSINFDPNLVFDIVWCCYEYKVNE